MLSLWILPTLPLLGAAICLFFHLREGKQSVSGERNALPGFVASFCVLAAFGAAFSFVTSIPAEGSRAITASLGDWIQAGSLSIPLNLRLDWLSGMLCLVITGVGGLIHLFSISYMKEEAGFARYFASLNLFVASMLLLVLGDSLPLMFVGWEGVGLCSYLLIGFFYEKEAPPHASQKAFVVNRIGDLGFLIGIFYLWSKLGALDFPSIQAGAVAGKLTSTEATIAALLLFTGAIGKSAQIPLYVWLPDAMAGPTPVSALIHAATMVTAGVYLVCRTSALFALSEIALPLVAAIGVATALYAATMALVERDIKKVLAYSTVSQLGFMFLGAGAGAFQASVFHLVTHAFFKALLFLAAGSVIHAMHGEQDIFKMGGLRKKLPITHLTFLIGVLALGGLPGLSGFISKDAILWGVAHHNSAFHWLLWSAATLTSAMTAFYSMRLYLLVFHGEPRFGHEKHPHESPFLMAAPLVVLAALAVAGGALGLPEGVFHHPSWIDTKLVPLFGSAISIANRTLHATLPHEKEILFIAISAAVALAGLAFAFSIYRKAGWPAAERAKANFPEIHRAWSAHYWVDEGYRMLVVSPLRLFAIGCSLFDLFVIDGLVNLFGHAAEATSRGLRRLQTGHLQNYALWFGLGAAALLFAAWIS